MGGYGSTRWGNHYRACTTGEAYSLDLAHFPMNDIFADELVKFTDYGYVKNGKSSGNIGIYFVPKAMQMVLEYQAIQDGNKQDVTQIIPLETMSLNFGGIRYWMRCPACNSRVRTLHMPPSGKRFRCRECHKLTYASCQDSRRYSGRLYQVWNIQDKIDVLHKKLRRCRHGSKNYIRYHEQLDKLYAQSNIMLAMMEAQNMKFRAKHSSYLDSVKHLVSNT